MFKIIDDSGGPLTLSQIDISLNFIFSACLWYWYFKMLNTCQLDVFYDSIRAKHLINISNYDIHVPREQNQGNIRNQRKKRE